MSRGKRQLSLIGQVDARLNGMLALGQSKHQAKKDGTFEECLTSPFWNAEHKNGRGKPKGGYDKNSVYHCRGMRKGQWMDKQAMLTVSQALGHNRISVVGEHYITV